MLICKICGFKGISLVSHIRYKHNISGKEYKIKFPNSVIHKTSEKQKNDIRKTLKKYYSDEDIRKNKSLFMKNGGSWRCVKYWIKRGYTEEEAKNEISKKQKKNFENYEWKPEYLILRKEYWLKRGYTEEEAKNEISKIQKERGKNSPRFLGKTRDEEQKRKISISMSKMIKKVGAAKWVSHFGDFKENFRSKGEIELYNYIKENVDKNAECNVFVKKYNVDIKYGNNIVEYFGDYWHCNPKKFEADYYHQIVKMTAKEIWEKDKQKIKNLENKGYNVKIVWESDWNKNKKIF